MVFLVTHDLAEPAENGVSAGTQRLQTQEAIVYDLQILKHKRGNGRERNWRRRERVLHARFLIRTHVAYSGVMTLSRIDLNSRAGCANCHS